MSMRLRQGVEILGAMAALWGVACGGEVEGPGGDSSATNPAIPTAGALAPGSAGAGTAAAGTAGTMQGSAGGRPGGEPMTSGGAGAAGTAGAIPGGTSGSTGG